MPNQATKTQRAKQQWVKVTYRLASKKARLEAAKRFESEYGQTLDPDGFNMTIAYPIDHCGFVGAFEAAKEYIADSKRNHGDTFEYRIDGGEW